MGALALVSGLLSSYARLDSVAIYFAVPLLPGVYFGLVLGIATYLWAGRDILRAAVVVLFTIVAWIAAERLTEHIHLTITSAMRALYSVPTESDAANELSSIPSALPYLTGLCGLIGGLVGSSITVCGVSIATPEFRAVPHWTRTILIGTLFGSLLEMFVKSSLPLHVGSDAPLYVCWQIAVATSIAYGFRPKN